MMRRSVGVVGVIAWGVVGSVTGWGQGVTVNLQQNAQAYVTKAEHKAPLVAAIRTIFNTANRFEAEALLAKTVLEWRKVNARGAA